LAVVDKRGTRLGGTLPQGSGHDSLKLGGYLCSIFYQLCSHIAYHSYLGPDLLSMNGLSGSEPVRRLVDGSDPLHGDCQ
jgi:hypothetical protein